MDVQGSWDGAVLVASAIGLVPCEAVEETRAAMGNANWFGGSERTAARFEGYGRWMGCHFLFWKSGWKEFQEM